MPDAPMGPEQEKPTVSKAEAIAKIREMQSAIKRIEATQGPSGAAPAMTYTALLDPSKAEEQNPGKRVRWVNLKNAARVQGRQAGGYERIPEAEGGRQVGDLALFRLPEGEYEKRVEALRKLNSERLQAHNREAEQIADEIARQLRDRHGVDVNPETIYGVRGGDPRRV